MTPGVHYTDCSWKARQAAEMLAMHKLQSIIDLQTMQYQRGAGRKKSAIDWIATDIATALSVTAEHLGPLETRG